MSPLTVDIKQFVWDGPIGDADASDLRFPPNRPVPKVLAVSGYGMVRLFNLTGLIKDGRAVIAWAYETAVKDFALQVWND